MNQLMRFAMKQIYTGDFSSLLATKLQERLISLRGLEQGVISSELTNQSGE